MPETSQVCRAHVFDERPAPHAGLDVDGVRARVDELAVSRCARSRTPPLVSLPMPMLANPVSDSVQLVISVSSHTRPMSFPSAPRPLFSEIESSPVSNVQPSMMVCLHESTSIPSAPLFTVTFLNVDVLAVHRMDRPHAEVLRITVLHAHVLAVVELDQRGQAHSACPVHPAPLRGRADDLARPNQADVLRVRCVDQAAVSLDPVALPAHLRRRIVGHVGRTIERRALLHPQHYVAAQRQRAGQIISRRNHHLAPAERRAALDRLLDRQRVLRLAVARRAVVAHVQLNRWPRGRLGSRMCVRARLRRVRRLRGGLRRLLRLSEAARAS